MTLWECESKDITALQQRVLVFSGFPEDNRNEPMKHKLIDLFCGAGGMTLGFVDPRFCGGFEPLLAVDLDRAALDTHEANFGGTTITIPSRNGFYDIRMCRRQTS